VEQGLAETLELKLGDRLGYEIGGQRMEGVVTSLRKLDWDSMRVNFFVIAPPRALENYPASYITSFHLPAEAAMVIPELVRRFPNITVIDVAALVRQLHATIDQVARAVQLVFGFAVLAGLAVLYAALQASADERRHELAVLRALGARSRQLAAALLAEFAALGALAGLLGRCCREPDRLGPGAIRVSPRLSAAARAVAGRRRRRPVSCAGGRLAGGLRHAAPVGHAKPARGGLTRLMQPGPFVCMTLMAFGFSIQGLSR
jgi:hypothetical protein